MFGENYEASLRYSLAMGGDSDTIACMAGCISAQVYGIPKQLLDDALVCLPVEQIAPLFKEARTVKNVLLPKAIVDILNWQKTK